MTSDRLHWQDELLKECCNISEALHTLKERLLKRRLIHDSLIRNYPNGE